MPRGGEQAINRERCGGGGADATNEARVTGEPGPPVPAFVSHPLEEIDRGTDTEAASSFGVRP
jgi:hypothetical protein